MKTHIVIVGFGVAGANLAFTLLKRNIDFIVIDKERETTSSKVAAGLYNPITGKRAVKTWLADELFPYAKTFYSEVEGLLGVKISHKKNVYRLFKDAGDANDIISKAYDEKFTKFINPEFDSEQIDKNINESIGGIEIKESGNIDLPTYLKHFKAYLEKENKFISGNLENQNINFDDKLIPEFNLEFEHIVFCEGYRAIENSLFNWLPFSVTKGEMLLIRSDFPESHIINKGFFLLPTVTKNEFWVGSSYERVADENISEKGRKIVTEKIGDFFKETYTIIDQKGAVRPTVRDRRPFLGQHPEIENAYIFNGMGTKGVTLSPYFANVFVDFMTLGTELDKQVDIKRYFSLYFDNK